MSLFLNLSNSAMYLEFMSDMGVWFGVESCIASHIRILIGSGTMLYEVQVVNILVVTVNHCYCFSYRICLVVET
jgi:hypothetical protein